MGNFENELRAAHTQLCAPSVVEPGEEHVDGSRGWFRERFVGENAVIGVVQEDDPNVAAANLSKTVVLCAFPDGSSHVKPKDKGQRVIKQPFELHDDGMIRAGGVHRNGSYRIVGAKDHVTGDARAAILARRGEHIFGDVVTDDMEVRAIGKSSRLDVQPDRSHSAFFAQDRRQNQIFLREISWLFETAKERIASGTLNEGSSLDKFEFLVAAGPQGLRPRWDNDRCTDHAESRRKVEAEAKRRAQDGAWDIPGFEGLVASVEGKVLAVDGSTVVIGTEDGSKLSIDAPVVPVRQYIQAMTGVTCDDLPVVPIVWPGKTVGIHTCLFGPIARQATGENHSLDLEVEHGGDGMAFYSRMRQVYAWTMLACGEQHDSGHTLYPLAFVAPDDLRRTFVKLSGRNTRGEPWDNRVQVNLLSSGAPTVLHGRGIGYEINLFNHSQRTQMLRQISRVSEAKAGGGKDKPRKAGFKKRKTSKQGRRKKAPAKTAVA